MLPANQSASTPASDSDDIAAQPPPKIKLPITFFPFDSGGEQSPRYLVEAGGCSFVANRNMYHLLRVLSEEPRTFAELAHEFQVASRQCISPRRLARLLKTGIPSHLFVDSPNAPSRTPLIFSWEFFSARWTQRVAGCLTWLFHRGICSAVLIAVAVLLALLLPESLRPLTVPIRPLTVALAYLGFCGIGLLHEFGHATACARYGCPPGPIGFGLYLIFPAFYTDVTSAWRLDRRARAIIDIGGVYFSCIAQLILGVAIVMVHSPLASTLFAINAYTILHNLNPVFKLDGYWLCSDLAGLHNLHLRMTEEVRRIVARLRRRPIPVSPEDAASQWLLRIYFAIVCLYTLFVARFLQLAIPNLLLSLPRAFAAAWHKALQGSPSFSESIANIATLIGTLVWPAMVVIALLVLLHRLCLAILRSTGRLAQAGNVENKQ